MLIQDLQRRLRAIVSAKIESGEMTGSELARRAGFQQAHISNFLGGRRGLSVEASDRILRVLHLQVEDLYPRPERVERLEASCAEASEPVPLVRPAALMQAEFATRDVRRWVSFPRLLLEQVRAERGHGRGHWMRWVAYELDAASADAMRPRLMPAALLLVDRYYVSLKEYRGGERNLYLVHRGEQWAVRYLEREGNQLYLRPERGEVALNFLSLSRGRGLGEFVVGRVVHAAFSC